MSLFDDPEPTAVLESLAVAMLTERSLTNSLRGLVSVAARSMPRCVGGSISMLVDGGPGTAPCTDRVVLELDLVQYDCSHGPLVAWIGGEGIRLAHLMADERLPHFAIGAADRRVVSTLSIPIRADADDERVVGTLDLYSRVVNGFGADDEEIALLIVAEAATAITCSKLYRDANVVRDRLQADLDEASEIALAEGILIALYDCTPVQATALLEQAAVTAGGCLDAARRIARSIELPPVGGL
jgi:GAF domain-containing protein